MRIVILGYTGTIGKSILEFLAKDTTLHLVCVGRNIINKHCSNTRIKYFKWDFRSFKQSNLLFLKKANIVINCVGKNDGDLYNLKDVNVTFVKKLLQYINNYNFNLRLVHLSSVAVYETTKNYFGNYKLISENSQTMTNNFYSKSKLEGDLLIQNNIKRNFNNNFSFTILRISNVFGGSKKSNLYKFIMFSLKFRFWIKYSDDIIFNFINVKDVAQAVRLTILKLRVSKNKIYIVSDDCKQKGIYKNYENLYKKKIFKINVSKNVIKFLIYFLPFSKKILNFITLISARVSYSNKKIKNELNFKPRFSLNQKKFLNEQKT